LPESLGKGCQERGTNTGRGRGKRFEMGDRGKQKAKQKKMNAARHTSSETSTAPYANKDDWLNYRERGGKAHVSGRTRESGLPKTCGKYHGLKVGFAKGRRYIFGGQGREGG